MKENELKYLKSIILEQMNEYYTKKTNSSSKPTKYPNFYVKKIEEKNDNDETIEYAIFTLRNLEKEDAWDVRNNVIKGIVRDVKVPPKKGYPYGYTRYDIEFKVLLSKAQKWMDQQIPKIQNYLENSPRAEYPNLAKLKSEAERAFDDCPSEAELRRMEVAMDSLKKEIYKAVQEGRFDDAMKIYNYSIELRARVYGHQLSPENARMIMSQAESAGITPNDHGPDKYWPTFCRSKFTWEKWGRKIIDNPRMRYVIWSVYGSSNGDDVYTGLKKMGWSNANAKNIGDFSKQQIEKATMGNNGYNKRGIVYDISDTEPIPGSVDDFAIKMGLENNIEGILNAPAMEKERELLAAEGGENQKKFDDADEAKKKQLEQIATDEGKATMFLDALRRVNGVQESDIDKTSKSQLDNYINSLIKIAEGRCRAQKWSNDMDIHHLALMIAAGVACQTIGAQRIKALHPDFSPIRFKDEGQFTTTLWAVMKNMVNQINYAVDTIYHEKSMAQDDPNVVKESFYNFLNRMNRVNESIDEEAMREEDEKRRVIDFLKSFGMSFENEN